MNPPDHQWVLEVRSWLISQVIKLDDDHKFRDGPLKHEIGNNFKSVREIERRLNAIARNTIDRRCATPPIWVEIDGDKLGKVTISV